MSKIGSMSLSALLLHCVIAFQACSHGRPPEPQTPADADRILQQAAQDAIGDLEGTIIVIDPQTGRLRAVVNPRLAFEQSFPPGSTIKPFTALVALRSGMIDNESSRLCRGRFARPDFEIECSHPKSRTPFNLSQAIAYSCNDYFARVGERISEGNYNATINSFGFGLRTGVNAVELPGRHARGEWNPGIALGESDTLLVTPIQLIASFTALINGGRLFRPQLHPELDYVAQEKTRLDIDPSHRAILIEGMRGAAKFGTAAKAGFADSPDYIFGKTGTSTASDGFRTQGWFVCFAAGGFAAKVPPPSKVDLGILVFLKRAHGSKAAEIARRVMDVYSSLSARRTRREAAATVKVDYSHRKLRVKSINEKIVRELSIEEYLIGVLAGESGVEKEFEALKAQAVASRAFALRNFGRHAREGFDFCSTTHCQRFVLPKSGSNAQARRAVMATEGEVLLDESGGVADVYFHASCGGMTAGIESLWGVARGPRHLRGVRDDFCSNAPHRNWSQTIATQQLLKALRSDRQTDVGPRLDSIVVDKRDASGRAELITISGAQRRVLRGWDFKLIVGRSLGWQMIKSSRFEVRKMGDAFVFTGSGFGHGLGLCQEGSHAAAKRGMNYRLILEHYFPGVRIGPAGSDRSLRAELNMTPALFHSPAPQNTHGGARSQASGENFRISFPSKSDRRSIDRSLRILEASLADLRARLLRSSVELPRQRSFEVVFHSSTEDFISATGRSGWAAGATRGRNIDLQPIEVLNKRRILENTLRHELTHAVIEVLSSGRAPRWLSEGLAIHYAGEGPWYSRMPAGPKLPLVELELRLSRPVQVTESRRLYAQAYREALALLNADGEIKVWRRIALTNV